MATECIETAHADRVQAQHDCCTALGHDQVVAAAHLIEFPRQIECIHDLAAAALGVFAYHLHTKPHTFVKRTSRAIGLQLVVLDEIDTGGTQLFDHGGRVRRTQTHRGFDDGAYQRRLRHAGQGAGTGYAKGRAGVGIGECAWQIKVKQTQRFDRP